MKSIVPSLTLFWLRACVVVLLNFGVIGVVVLRSDPPGLAPVRAAPADGARGVSILPVIRLSFPRAIDPVTLGALLRLDPPAPGYLTVSGPDVTFTPAEALQPDTAYTLTIGRGVRDNVGRPYDADTRIHFQTRSPRLIVLRREAAIRNAWGIDPQSGEEWRITNEKNGVQSVVASRDGESIAYVTQDAPGVEVLHTVRTDGRDPWAVARFDASVVRSVSWSPQGDALVYEETQLQNVQAGSFRIWLIRADGSQRAMLYGRGIETGSYPTWAPDGRHLAFYERRFGLIGVFGFTRSLLTVADSVAAPVSWSPDGTSLTFVDRIGDSGALGAVYVADVHSDPAVVRQITSGVATDETPAWAPRGDWIAFTRVIVGGRNGVWLVRADGRDEHALFEEPGWVYGRAYWSPDGGAVAVNRVPVRGGQAGLEAEIWAVPLNGVSRPLLARGELVDWTP